ncbi:MAG: cupin domain-containing protein [Myxococcota bacterium]
MAAAVEILLGMIAKVRARVALGADADPRRFVTDAVGPHPTAYANRNERLNIDFTVAKLGFPELQTMDPRIVRIAPGANNERHRHAHESIFVIVQGEGEVLVGETWQVVREGDVAFVPRWIFHQTRNTSDRHPLVLVAITDFGFTSAILGNYDKRTRLAAGGDDAEPHATLPAPLRATPRAQTPHPPSSRPSPAPSRPPVSRPPSRPPEASREPVSTPPEVATVTPLPQGTPRGSAPRVEAEYVATGRCLAPKGPAREASS